jgi:hypothetical protein
MLQPNWEGICASLDTDVGIWDAVARSDKDGQVTVAVVNIRDKTYQVHKGDVFGSFRNPEQSGEELVPLDDEVVASIFGKIRKDPKEPERGQTESIDSKTSKGAGGTTADSCNGFNKDKVQGINYAVP